MLNLAGKCLITAIRPGKVDFLFSICHFLNFDTGRHLFFTVHYKSSSDPVWNFLENFTTLNHPWKKAAHSHVQ